MGIDESSLFIIWLSLQGPLTPSRAAIETSLPKTTVYRKLRELEDRGWLERKGKTYLPTDRAKILGKMEAKDMLGIFHIEELFEKALRLQTGSWRRSMELLRGRGMDFVLCYETAAYIRTGFQTPSAAFAYVRDSELKDWISLGKRAPKFADLVLIPVRELPTSEVISGWPVVTEERLRLELIVWLGRGILDLAALRGKVPMVAEEMTDVVY
ncbi:MAG: helix-turn-helix domain-containing protein [Candidatus Korarchaeota archaeon]|nr:helix-turn-helix domain-containing protein [Candidatus Korarchaeota archaeon]